MLQILILEVILRVLRFDLFTLMSTALYIIIKGFQINGKQESECLRVLRLQVFL